MVHQVGENQPHDQHRRGAFAQREVAAGRIGRYRMKAWHERTMLTEQVVDVGAAGGTVSVRMEAK